MTTKSGWIDASLPAPEPAPATFPTVKGGIDALVADVLDDTSIPDLPDTLIAANLCAATGCTQPILDQAWYVSGGPLSSRWHVKCWLFATFGGEIDDMTDFDIYRIQENTKYDEPPSDDAGSNDGV